MAYRIELDLADIAKQLGIDPQSFEIWKINTLSPKPLECVSRNVQSQLISSSLQDDTDHPEATLMKGAYPCEITRYP